MKKLRVKKRVGIAAKNAPSTDCQSVISSYATTKNACQEKFVFAENSAASGQPPDMKDATFRARCWGIFSTIISRADFVKQEQQLLLDNSCSRAF